MRTGKLYRTLLAVAAAGFMMAGCENVRNAGHETFKKPMAEKWDRAVTQIQLQSVEQQYKAGDYEKCRQSLSALLAKNVPFAPLYVLSAKVEMEEGGRLDVAQESVKRAIEIDPEMPEAYYLYGVLYQRWQRLEKARDYYMIAQIKKPGDATYVLAAVEMQLALGELEAARTMIEDKLPAFEQSAAMRVALGRIAGLEGKKDEAIKNYREASTLVPEDKNVRWSYAQALFEGKKYGEAVKILEELKKDPPRMPKARISANQPVDIAMEELAQKSTKASILLQLAESYAGLNRTQEARDTLQEVIRIQPDNLTAYISLGKVCLMTNEPRLTIAAAQKVLRSEPGNVQAMILHGAALQKQKKWSEAIEPLTAANKIAPKDATVWCMIGVSELQLGKKEAAEASFAKAVSVDPSNSWATELLTSMRPHVDAMPVGPVLPGVDGLLPGGTNPQ